MGKPEPKTQVDIATGTPAGPRAQRIAGGDVLTAALDRLEERIKLLLARHAELAERHREAMAAQRALDGGLDPVTLDARVRSLEADNDRLARHAAHLEDRIRDLLARVRYAVES